MAPGTDNPIIPVLFRSAPVPPDAAAQTGREADLLLAVGDLDARPRPLPEVIATPGGYFAGLTTEAEAEAKLAAMS